MSYPECLKQIRAVVTDVDGVLTDGGMYYSENGDELKKFNVRDGAGVALLREAGIIVGVITGEETALVKRRLAKLGITEVSCGVVDKRKALATFCGRNGLTAEQVAYIGDEINDAPLLGRVGCFFAPMDACGYLLEHAEYVIGTCGGAGVMRDVAEIVLRSQSKLRTATEGYIRRLREPREPN